MDVQSRRRPGRLDRQPDRVGEVCPARRCTRYVDASATGVQANVGDVGVPQEASAQSAGPRATGAGSRGMWTVWLGPRLSSLPSAA